MVYKFSPSSLRLMEECKRCFWLGQKGEWKRPMGIFPSLPNGIDRALKVYFDSFRIKGEIPPELKREGLEGIRLFGRNDEERAFFEEWRSNWKGMQYQDDKGNIITGAIDDLLVREEKFIVLDYKTRGFPLKEDTHLHYKSQLDIYNFILGKKGYKVEDYSYLLFYYPNKFKDNGEFLFNTSLVKVDANGGDAEKLFNGAIEILEGDCPKHKEKIEERCEWCKFVEFKQ